MPAAGCVAGLGIAIPADGCGSPGFPWWVAFVPELVEHAGFAVGVHGLPEAGVAVGGELSVCGELGEGGFFEDAVGVEVVQGFGLHDEEADVDPAFDLGFFAETGDVVGVVDVHDPESTQGLHGGDGGEGALLLVEGDEFGDVDVGEAVAVGDEEGCVVEVFGCSMHASAGHGGFAGVGDGDGPVGFVVGVVEVQGVAGSELNSEVVVAGFVVEEVLLNHVALVAGGNDEVGDAVVGKVFHDVPEHGAPADFDHGFGAEFGFFAHAGAKTAGEDDGFHRLKCRVGDAVFITVVSQAPTRIGLATGEVSGLWRLRRRAVCARMRVADVLAGRLASWGVDRGFVVTGGGAMHLDDAFAREPGITVTYLHHEQACAMAAEGWARVTGRPALLCVTSGPGVLNALNGVFGAYTDSVPMVVVSGQVRSDTSVGFHGLARLRQLGDQEVRTGEVASPIVKRFHSLSASDDVVTVIDELVRVAVSGRPGPVWLEVPVDVQGAEVAVRVDVGLALWVRETTDVAGDARRVVAALSEASRPVILLGTGVRTAGCVAEVDGLAQILGVPVVTAWSHDTFDNHSPLYAGRPGTIGTRAGNMVVQNADFVLVLGSRLNIRQVSYNWSSFAADAAIAMVDIDSAELAKPYLNVDIPIAADLRDFVPAMTAQAAAQCPREVWERWRTWCQEISKRYEPVWADYPRRAGGINPYHFVMRLFEHVRAQDVVVCGDATACIVPFQVGRLPQGARMFSNSGCASMGYDLPAGIGAALANVEGRTLIVAGDGSVMMNIQELVSLAHLDRDVVLVILDNEGYLSIKQTQRNFFGVDFGNSPSSGVPFPDFGAVAAAFGLPVTVLRVDSDWVTELDVLMAGSAPRVVVVELDADQEFAPRLKSKMTSFGITTPELDDMFPFLNPAELSEVRRSARALSDDSSEPDVV